MTPGETFIELGTTERIDDFRASALGADEPGLPQHLEVMRLASISANRGGAAIEQFSPQPPLASFFTISSRVGSAIA